MTQTVDDYLARLERRLTVGAELRAQILAEVRAHLDEAAAERMAAGAEPAAAQAQALAAFGAPNAVAASFNRVHPVEWDRGQVLRGVAWGALVTWLAWTLVTFPLLVRQTLATGHVPGGYPDDALGILFGASPLGFGAFWVLAYSPLDLALWLGGFLLLFCLAPVAWGRRARAGWKPGLAFGLGLVVGFPWLLPAVFLRWAADGRGPSLIVVVLAIWLLVPIAMAASWLGARSHRLRLPARLVRRHTVAMSTLQGRAARRSLVPAALGVCLLLALLAVNGWSFATFASWAAHRLAPTVDEQLAAAERAAGFTIRAPAYIPDGMTLQSVRADRAWCGTCAVTLQYTGPHGARLTLDEHPSDPTGPLVPAPPEYQVSQGVVGGVRPVWWLQTNVTQEQQLNLVWTAGGMEYFLSTNGVFPLEQVKQIAASIPADATSTQR